METAHTASVQGFTRKISAGKKAKKEKTKAPAVPCDSCQDGVDQTDSDDDDTARAVRDRTPGHLVVSAPPNVHET
jgi:hypothetical protein